MSIEMCFQVSPVFDISFFIANAAHESYFTVSVIPISNNTSQVGTASTWIASFTLKKSRWTISSKFRTRTAQFFPILSINQDVIFLTQKLTIGMERVYFADINDNYCYSFKHHSQLLGIQDNEIRFQTTFFAVNPSFSDPFYLELPLFRVKKQAPKCFYTTMNILFLSYSRSK